MSHRLSHLNPLHFRLIYENPQAIRSRVHPSPKRPSLEDAGISRINDREQRSPTTAAVILPPHNLLVAHGPDDSTDTCATGQSSNGDSAKENQSNRRHACKAHGCDKSFVQLVHLYRHDRAAHDGQTYGFLQQPSRERQQKRESDGRYECKTCGRSYVKLKDLYKHEREVHTGQVKHVCETCSVEIARSSDLKRHIKSHTGAPCPLRSGHKVTWNPRTHARSEAQAKAQPVPGHEEEYEDIIHLALSKPAKSRHAANSEAFNPQGKLRDRYFFLRDRILEEKGREKLKRGGPKVPPPGRREGLRPRREPEPELAVHPPHVDPFKDRAKAHQILPPREVPFLEITANFCYDWEPPKGWSKFWPKDPMHIPPGEPRCDFHEDTKEICNCIIEIQNKIQPEVVDCEGKGQGLKAVAPEEDEDIKMRRRPVYCRGEVIGELLGDIKNDNPCFEDWCMRIERRDLRLRLRKGEILAVLYCRYSSNCWRKVNHTCKNANVEFQEMTISWKRRIAVVALDDIFAGDWIEGDYGPDYWKGREQDCKCGNCGSLEPQNEVSKRPSKRRRRNEECLSRTSENDFKVIRSK